MFFTKMHGLGNDYVFIFNNDEIDNINELARRISDRHFGVGSDGLIIISNSEVADFKMDIYNSDGSIAMMCGNGLRCVGKYIYDNKLSDKKELNIETKSGIRKVDLIIKNDEVDNVIEDMGEPLYKESFKYNNIDFTLISIGNPHAVTIVKDVNSVDINKIGKEVSEKYNVNVEFIEIVDPSYIKMRVYERGSGETMACATGAAASLVYSSINGLSNNEVIINLPGGNLIVTYSKDNHVYIKGEAKTVFKGNIDEEKLLKLTKNSR